MVKKIKNYQNILESFLQGEAKDKEIPGIEVQVVADKKNNHYQLVESGWYEKQYIYSVLFHFHIKPNGKIWVLANNTDVLIGEELIKRGIPASDMVIGFHPTNVRQFTGYATA
jgi:hypothetical protein